MYLPINDKDLPINNWYLLGLCGVISGLIRADLWDLIVEIIGLKSS